jgi:tellurite resistance protein
MEFSTMRSYPVDSPRACARALALTLIADGGVSETELKTLASTPDALTIRLDGALMDTVLRELCEDLQTGSRRRWGRELEMAQIEPMLDEIRDPFLRSRVLQMAYDVAQSDGRLSDGEGRLIALMNRRWQPENWAIAA